MNQKLSAARKSIAAHESKKKDQAANRMWSKVGQKKDLSSSVEPDPSQHVSLKIPPSKFIKQQFKKSSQHLLSPTPRRVDTEQDDLKTTQQLEMELKLNIMNQMKPSARQTLDASPVSAKRHLISVNSSEYLLQSSHALTPKKVL